DGPADVDLAVVGHAVPPIKDGAGRLEVRTPFRQDPTQVAAGVVRYVNAGGTSVVTGNMDVADGATIEFSGGLALPVNFVPKIIGNGVNGAGVLHSLDGTNTLGGIALKGNARVAVDAGTLSAGLGGVAASSTATNLIKDGAGTLSMGASPYSWRTG